MKKKLIKILVLVLLISCHSKDKVQAANYSYNASQASTISSKTFAAGDVITLQNGNWSDKNITIKGNGTQDNPILVNAQTAGEVIFTGSSRLTIDGKYIEVSGILFSGNSTVGTNHVLTFSKNSANCRFTNSAIVSYNPATASGWATTDNKWVSINGTSNRVDHCYFENKRNIGTLLVVWLVDDESAKHKIDNNHFYKRVSLLDEDEKELNGQETIRIGDSKTSMTSANCIIESNFFEECDGEIEIISNKSCGNIYRNNVFYNNNAMLTLRHGNACEVSGNYFFGKEQPGSGGVRIIGENHNVFNNYFQDLKGSGYRTGVCMVNGKTNSALSEYFQVKNALVAFNTFYNCANAFNIGYSGGEDLAPVTSTIAHNVVFATSNSQIGVKISNAASEITWQNNLMYQGKHTSFSPSESQFKRVTTSLNFQSSNTEYGIYKPQSNSIIVSQYRTSAYPEITMDIEGKTRESQRMIGAFEYNGNLSLSVPTPQTAGCSFINKATTGAGNLSVNNPAYFISNLRTENNVLHIEAVIDRLNLRIYDVKGLVINAQSAQSVTNSFTFEIPDSLKGFYLFVFDGGGAKEIRKIIIG
ncbi:MAG: hypothetical protein LBS07_06380 [Prevotellaceae bacterium]|jgi:poly(beta-D-mannuronate) lyase|nr:hypothetical protein [Prevotellaceae bacterium]